jgi:hypothetical protein
VKERDGVSADLVRKLDLFTAVNATRSETRCRLKML